MVYRVAMKKFNWFHWFYWFEQMISAGLRIKAYAYFFIGGDEKMKFFNEWFIGLRVLQSFA